MKKIISISLIALLGIFFFQCEPEDDLVTKDAKKGGLIDISTTAINYVVGDGASYGYDLYLYQNDDVQITTVNILKSFYAGAVAWSDPDDTTHTEVDSIPAKWSDEIIEETITITESGSHWISVTALDYAGLRAGLTIDGAALPVVDGNMRIGDYFNFVVEAELDNGDVVIQAKPVTMTVSTRFAGTYVVLAGEYWHPAYWPVAYMPECWVGDEVSIKSVDAITYLWEDWGPLSGWEAQTLYFQIDGSDNISFPVAWDGVDQALNDCPLGSCLINPAEVPHLPCIDKAVRDNVNGKDQLIMGYAYMGGSGPREFFFTMEKKVE